MSDINEGTITIDARAKGDFEPDKFRILVSFAGHEDDRAKCVTTYNENHRRVRNALMAAGIPADQIKTSAFRVTRRYDWLYEKVSDSPHERYKRAERFVDGYEYHGDCSVEGEMDSALLALVWGLLQELDGGFSFDIGYTLDQPDACERELLRTAVADAYARACVLAEATGANLGAATSVHHRFMHAAIGYSKNKAALALGSFDEPLSEFAGGGSEAPDFNPEPIEIACEVTISWAIV